MKERKSKLRYDAEEINRVLLNLEEGQDNHENRKFARHSVKIPIEFLRRDEDGSLVKAEYRSTLSQIVDLSKRGAGFISGRRFSHGDLIYVNGYGNKKAFKAQLEVVHVKRLAQHHRYGCKLLGFKSTAS